MRRHVLADDLSNLLLRHAEFPSGFKQSLLDLFRLLGERLIPQHDLVGLSIKPCVIYRRFTFCKLTFGGLELLWRHPLFHQSLEVGDGAVCIGRH